MKSTCSSEYSLLRKNKPQWLCKNNLDSYSIQKVWILFPLLLSFPLVGKLIPPPTDEILQNESCHFLHTCRLSPVCCAGAFSSNLASSCVAMTLTLLLFPTAAESIFLTDRTAGTDGLSSRPALDNSSYENVGKTDFVFFVTLVGLINLFCLKLQAQHLRHLAVRATHIFRLAGFSSLPQTVYILLFFVLLVTCRVIFLIQTKQWHYIVSFLRL